ncbi:MAG: YihY/virulence factor BrkB family protein [Planctomycetota bacterium]
MTAKDVWAIVREAGTESLADRVPRLGAALAFYTTFSLAPLLLVVVAIAGLVFGREAAEGKLLSEMRSLVGNEGGDALQSMVAAAGKQGSGILASVIGGVILLFGAIGLFGELQDALNTIWEVQPKPGGGWWGFVRTRLLSFSAVLGVAFLLLVSLVISTVMSALNGLLGGSFSGVILNLIQWLVSFGVITGLFAMIYRLLPDAEIAWRDVWFGALVTSVLFALGKSLIGLYLGQTAVTSVYGAAASFAILMLWNYYTAQIFLFGAELTKAYAIRCGSGIIPSALAEAVTRDARRQQGLATTI